MNGIYRGKIYRHYKGNNYKVIDLVCHSDDAQELVLYECLYDNDISRLWVRPLKEFLEIIDTPHGPVKRFEYIGNQKGRSRL